MMIKKNQIAGDFKMKNENVLLLVGTAIILALLFLPLPATINKLLVIIDFIFSICISVLGMYAAIKKRIPKCFAEVLLFFILFNLSLSISTTRQLLTVKNTEEILSVVNGFVIENPIGNYILTGILIISALVCSYLTGNKYDDKTIGSIKFLRGNIKFMIIIFAGSIICGAFRGMKTFDCTFKESILFYLPYCCTQTSLFFIPLIIATVGTVLLRWIDNTKK